MIKAQKIYRDLEANYSTLVKFEYDTGMAWAKCLDNLVVANGGDIARAKELRAEVREEGLEKREHRLVEQAITEASRYIPRGEKLHA